METNVEMMDHVSWLERKVADMERLIDVISHGLTETTEELGLLRAHLAGNQDLPLAAGSAKVAVSATAAGLALGALVREVRERLGWSREKFALHLGLDKAAIQLAEQGTLRLDRASMGRITALAPAELTEQLVVLSGNPELPEIESTAPAAAAPAVEVQPDDLCAVCGHRYDDHFQGQACFFNAGNGKCDCLKFTPANKAGKPAADQQ